MNLVDFFTELFEVLDDADIGLNVPGVDSRRAGPPAPYMELPEIIYGDAGPGLDRIPDLGVTVVFGPANNARVFLTALEYASTTGTRSVRAALHAHTWTSCDTLYVRHAEPTIETVQGGNPQLAYTFHLDITGAP